jgi:hypothetical protein
MVRNTRIYEQMFVWTSYSVIVAKPKVRKVESDVAENFRRWYTDLTNLLFVYRVYFATGTPLFSVACYNVRLQHLPSSSSLGSCYNLFVFLPETGPISFASNYGLHCTEVQLGIFVSDRFSMLEVCKAEPAWKSAHLS